MVVVVVVLLFKSHEIDEKRCGEQRRLEFGVKIDGESDREVVESCAAALTTAIPHSFHCAGLTVVGIEDLKGVFQDQLTTSGSFEPRSF